MKGSICTFLGGAKLDNSTFLKVRTFSCFDLLCLVSLLPSLRGSLDADSLPPFLLFSRPERQGPQILSGTQPALTTCCAPSPAEWWFDLLYWPRVCPTLSARFVPVCSLRFILGSGAWNDAKWRKPAVPKLGSGIPERVTVRFNNSLTVAMLPCMLCIGLSAFFLGCYSFHCSCYDAVFLDWCCVLRTKSRNLLNSGLKIYHIMYNMS